METKRKSKIVVKCKFCQSEISRRPSAISVTGLVFCDRDCLTGYHKKINTVKCPVCSVEFIRTKCNQKYKTCCCLRKCSNILLKKSKKHKCSQCGMEFDRIPSETRYKNLFYTIY